MNEINESGSPNLNGRFFFKIQFSWQHPDGSVKDLEKLSPEQSADIFRKALEKTKDFDQAIAMIQFELNELIGRKYSR